jgi:hypothetical protein
MQEIQSQKDLTNNNLTSLAESMPESERVILKHPGLG